MDSVLARHHLDLQYWFSNETVLTRKILNNNWNTFYELLPDKNFMQIMTRIGHEPKVEVRGVTLLLVLQNL